MVTVEFKPKRTAMAFHKLTDENAQMSREREPEYVAWASPCSYPWADDRILLYEIYDSRARPFHLRSPVLAAFEDQRRLVMNKGVAGFDFFEGSNIRR